MNIINLGSGSSGNAFIVESCGSRILLECGFPYKDLLKRAKFDLPKNCLISHSHGDHSVSAVDFVKWGGKVYTSAGTAEALGCGIALPKREWSEVGGFSVYPFETQHDCVDPVGYFIVCNKSNESLLFVLDTCYLRYVFNKLFTHKSYIMIECNFDRETLSEKANDKHLERVIENHMSLQDLKLMLSANDLSSVESIYLCHLSQENLDWQKAKKEVQELTGLPVYLANKNGGFSR